MIHSQTSLNVLDNSGAKKVKCVQLLGNGPPSHASPGDTVVVSIRKVSSKNVSSPSKRVKVTRGGLHYAVLVRSTKENHSETGAWTRFGDNAVVLVNEAGSPHGTRVRGPISGELRSRNRMKIMSLTYETP